MLQCWLLKMEVSAEGETDQSMRNAMCDPMKMPKFRNTAIRVPTLPASFESTDEGP